MRLKKLVFIIFVFIFNFFFSQKASIFESITESDGLPSNYVFNVAEDHNHIIWFGTDKGLVTYQDGNWFALDVDNGMPGNYINKIIADNKNGLLIYFYEKGLFFFNTNTKTLTKKYKEIHNNEQLEMSFANLDKEFIIIHQFSLQTQKHKYFAYDRNNNKQLFPLNIIKKQNINLFQLNSGKIIATEQIFKKNNEIVFGKYILEKSPIGIIRKENKKIIDTLSEEDGLASNSVSDFLKIKSGDLYITTLGGGISLLKKNNSKISFLNKNINTRDIVYQNEKKYIISDGYLYVLDQESIQNRYFLRKDVLSFNVYGNDLLVGSFEGLHFYTLTPKPVLIKTFPITTGISKIYKENDRIIFTTYGRGIFELKNGKIKQYKNFIFDNIENFFKLNTGYAVTSYEYGVNILDKNFKFKTHFDKHNGLESNFVTFAFADNDSIYVGTKKGVTTFYKNKPVFFFNSKNGYKGNWVRNIFRDKKNQIWILTDLFLYKKSGNIVKPIGSIKLTDDDKDKIIKSYYSKTENQIFTVTKNKFSIIDIDQLIPNKIVNPVILEKITVDGQIISNKEKIRFTDSDNDIYFIFKSVDKEILTQTKLYYKVNKQPWKPFTQPRALKFSHLERGKYTLDVKAVNEDGYENKISKPLHFKVVGPFYIRWWFIISSGLFASFAIYTYLNERKKRKYVKRLNDLRIKHQVENERKRIGRDLHDNIGAYVTSLISKIDILKYNHQNPASNEVSCDDVRLDAEHILALLRQTIFVLANKDSSITALYDNFKTYALKFLQVNNIRIIFEENIENNKKINPKVSSGIFRIMQEALQNIHKHAEATKVEVNLISKNKIIISIKDNGKGFKPNSLSTGFGLKNMKERAAEIGFKLNIYSDKTGTTIELIEV